MSTLVVRSYNYEPTAWSVDTFINHNDPTQKNKEWIEERIRKLKEEVRASLVGTRDTVELVNIIDTVEHLGIGYHFKREIDDALSRLHDAILDSWDLHHVATRFRLLRQHGFNASSDEFLRFKDGRGNFDEKLEKDAKGLLSLYNAGYLAIPGEGILDDAVLFARCHLTLMVDDLKNPLKKQVERALKTPFHRIITRVETRYFIEEYEEANQNDTLLELAKLDFNVLQSLHLKEMKELSLWWKGLNIGENLKYARDRLLECFAMWGIGLYFQPEYSRARIMVTKIYSLLIIADDTFDVQGTYEDCKLLNEAIQRWDVKSVDVLPMYLRGFCLDFIETINSLEDELEPGEKYRMPYLIEAIKTMINGYMQEIEWQAGGHVPSFEERKSPAFEKSIGAMVLAPPFIGVSGKIVTKDLFQLFNTTAPDVFVDSMKIIRYMDDFVTFERELKSGQGPTTIRCYMNEHNLTKEEAFVKFQSVCEDAWKRLNQAYLRPTVAPMPVLKRLINIGRVMETFYLYFDDGFRTCSNVKEITALLLLKPFSLEQAN